MRRSTLLGLSSFLLACRPGPRTEPPPPEAPPTSSAPAEDTPLIDASEREAPSDPASDAPPSAGDTTLCKAIVDDLGTEELAECTLVAGVTLDAGRAHIVEVKFEEPAMGEVTQAFIALVSDDGTPSFELAGESYFVAGEETTYVLGELQVVDGTVHLECTETTTTFPNTGDPDADPEEEQEVVKRRFVCDVRDGVCDEQP